MKLKIDFKFNNWTVSQDVVEIIKINSVVDCLINVVKGIDVLTNDEDVDDFDVWPNLVRDSSKLNSETDIINYIKFLNSALQDVEYYKLQFTKITIDDKVIFEI